MSEEFERILIAQIISDASIIDEHLITPELFESEACKTMFEAICKARLDYRRIDKQATYFALSAKNAQVAQDFIALQPYSAANAGFYVQKLRDMRQKEAIQHALLAGRDMLKAHEKSGEEIAQELMQELNRSIGLMHDDNASIQQIALDYHAVLDERIRNRRNNKIITPMFGLPELDALCDLINRGEVVVIAGRPGAGKTALAIQFALHAARAQGIPSLFFSMEMTRHELMDRFVAQSKASTLSKLRGGYVANDEIEGVQDEISSLYAAPIYVYDMGETMAKLRARIRREVAAHKVRLVVIDYLGLLEIDMSKNTPRWQQIGEISRQLKLLAIDLGIVIVEVVQMNREADGVEPTLGVLRDSGSIEQDADRVILLHEKKKGENDYRDVSAIVAKNRHGACGRVELMFDGKHVRFEQGSGA